MSRPTVFNSPEGRDAVLQYYDMLLHQAPASLEKATIETRFGDTFVLASGKKSAPPLILLHGSSMNSVMWVRDMQEFKKSFRVYAVDMPGEPGRSVEKQLPFDTLDYSNWLMDVLNGLLVQRAALMGISLGAWLSAKFTIANPDRVSDLVLLCPAGIGPQNHGFKEVSLSLLSKGESGVDELFTLINGGTPIPEIMLNYQKLIAMNFNTRKEPVPLFTDDELKLLTIPSILFFGEKDIILDALAATERYKRLVSDAQVVLLPDKGHSLTGMADIVMAFLAHEYKNHSVPTVPSISRQTVKQDRER